MDKILLFFLGLLFITSVTLATIFIFGKKQEYKPGVSSTVDKAVASARKVYDEKKLEGMDFSQGPCLSNDLIQGWVLDIVHTPRQAIDDLAQNQCGAYREGRADHFVELDTQGNIVRVK